MLGKLRLRSIVGAKPPPWRLRQIFAAKTINFGRLRCCADVAGNSIHSLARITKEMVALRPPYLHRRSGNNSDDIIIYNDKMRSDDVCIVLLAKMYSVSPNIEVQLMFAVF